MDMAVQYSDQGIFIPTEDLIRQYVPRLATIYEEHPEYKQGSTTPNGHSFGFPYIEEVYGLVRTRGPFMINTQWLEKVKFLMPWNLETGTVLVHSLLPGQAILFISASWLSRKQLWVHSSAGRQGTTWWI